MSENPHAAELITHRNRGNSLSPTVEATLALAHEQRTANLIALEALLHRGGAEIDVIAIQERLGLS